MSSPPDQHPNGQEISNQQGPQRLHIGALLSKAWTWLKWPAAIGVLCWLYSQHSESIAKIIDTPKAWGFAVAGFVLIVGSTLLTFLRWYLLVRAQDFPFRLRDAIRFGFIGLVANYVSPGAVGGDLFKGILLARDQSSRRVVAFATILLDRILGLLALFLVGAVTTLLPSGIPDNPNLKSATLLLWCGAGGGLVGLAAMLIPATTKWRWVNNLASLQFVGRMIGELIEGVKLYQSKPKIILASLGISVLGHAGLITGFYFCALWMQQPATPDLVGHFYFLPTAELFAVLIPSPGGMGALEGAVSWFYEQLCNGGGEEKEIAVAAGFMAAIAYRIVAISIALIGSISYFISRREIAVALSQASSKKA